MLVTGGAGAIGSHLVDALLARGDEVAVLDSFHDFYPREIKERNLLEAQRHPGFRELFCGDIREQDFVRRCFSRFRPEAVAHLAARAGVRPSVEDPVGYCDVNVHGTSVVAAEAARSGADRLVFASSSTVYGETDATAFAEDSDTGEPVSPYGASKRAGELVCYALHRSTGIAITALRFFSVYGPRQRPDLAVARFARQMLRNEPIVVLGDGSVERDFTYYTDTLAGILAALDRARGFHVYNLGRGEAVKLNDVIAMLERELGVSVRRETRPAHPADMPRTRASIERAARDLDYAPRVPIAEGIAAYVRWLREWSSGAHAVAS